MLLGLEAGVEPIWVELIRIGPELRVMVHRLDPKTYKGLIYIEKSIISLTEMSLRTPYFFSSNHEFRLATPSKSEKTRL